MHYARPHANLKAVEIPLVAKHELDAQLSTGLIGVVECEIFGVDIPKPGCDVNDFLRFHGQQLPVQRRIAVKC